MIPHGWPAISGKEETISDTIERQINFTGTYQDMGVTAPAWQNVQAGVLRSPHSPCGM